MRDILSVFEAVSQAFPMIVSANLTKNTYTMIKDDGFLADELPMTGKYDDLIDYGVENIHPNYQSLFLQNFSREKLLQSFGQGKREVTVKLYQKGRGKQSGIRLEEHECHLAFRAEVTTLSTPCLNFSFNSSVFIICS